MATKTLSIPVEKFDVTKMVSILTPEMVEKQDKMKKMKQPYWGLNKYKYPVNENGTPKEVEGTLVIITDTIKLVMGGIPKNPKDGEPIYADEYARAKFIIPIDDAQPGCVKLAECLSKIDTRYGNPKIFETSLTGLKGKNYEYSTMIREPSDKAKEGFRYRTVKASLDVDFETKAIKTKIFIKKPDGNKEQVPINSLTDVEKYVRFNCEFKGCFAINKLWATKSKMGGKTYSYGVGMKCLQLVITNPGSGGLRQDFNQYMFDDEGEVIEVAPVKQQSPKAEPKKVSKMITASDTASDDEEKKPTEDDDDDDEPAPAPAPKKPMKKEESSDDEDEDEEEVPKKPAPKKPVKKEEDSDEEDEPPKKSKLKKVANKKKQETSDEEDDD